MPSKALQSTINAIDDVNQCDPNKSEFQGQLIANEILYSQRMSSCLAKFWPNSNEYLTIAVHAQHIKRWHLKRNSYPEGKQGYLTWRKELGIMHAQLTKELMIDNGYNEEQANITACIIRKEKLKRNQDSQTLEDVACLVFLQYYFDEFAAKHEDEKVISILQKTWKKMSDRGHKIALSLTLPNHLATLVQKALS